MTASNVPEKAHMIFCNSRGLIDYSAGRKLLVCKMVMHGESDLEFIVTDSTGKRMRVKAYQVSNLRVAPVPPEFRFVFKHSSFYQPHAALTKKARTELAQAVRYMRRLIKAPDTSVVPQSKLSQLDSQPTTTGEPHGNTAPQG